MKCIINVKESGFPDVVDGGKEGKRYGVERDGGMSFCISLYKDMD